MTASSWKAYQKGERFIRDTSIYNGLRYSVGCFGHVRGISLF